MTQALSAELIAWHNNMITAVDVVRDILGILEESTDDKGALQVVCEELYELQKISDPQIWIPQEVEDAVEEAVKAKGMVK